MIHHHNNTHAEMEQEDALWEEASTSSEGEEASDDGAQWLQSYFRNHSTSQFLHTVRMRHASFVRLLRLVKRSPLLQSRGVRPLKNIPLQLALCLRRLGSMETCQAIALQFGVSTGSVIKITERMCRALISVLRPVTGLWMTPDERVSVRAEFLRLTGLDGAVIDVTHVTFLQRPKASDADGMYTYKKRYAIAVQGVADHKLRIRNYFICRTAHDAGIFAASSIGRDPALLPGEFLLGDAAYPCGPRMLRPFQIGTSRSILNLQISSMPGILRE